MDYYNTKIQDYKELMRNTFLGQSDVGLFILLQDVSSLFTFTIHKVFLLTGNNMAYYYVKVTTLYIYCTVNTMIHFPCRQRRLISYIRLPMYM